ncbi:bifunctional 4-hydroxy-2-oxoglutarate aldolase/2-dehydro-3-deoxy-phosphogluconate aldolase [Photobacterium japonica]|uniref:bifunctional 4-hydroxy-2-oxoglutarate aldolase/2-dehydro-3-deoxy-phosphogluconate aldolase n=1 Tax=Photobacterium japonica TaxID=2910235 RepID=UPI003D0FBF6D
MSCTLQLAEQLKAMKVVPVIAIKDADHAVALAKTLIENGLPCAEVTFRTAAAGEAIRRMREAYPEMLIGSGTVLTKAQVDESIEAGVNFIVTPAFNPDVVAYCLEKNMPVVPGTNNPSTVDQAYSMGLRMVKFFPAEASGGIAMLKSLSAVYPMTFMPTGGISENNIGQYLAQSCVAACGGTWMVPGDLIDAQNWDEIGRLVRQAVAALQ